MKPMIAILALGPRLFPGASQSNAGAKDSGEDSGKPALRLSSDDSVEPESSQRRSARSR